MIFCCVTVHLLCTQTQHTAAHRVQKPLELEASFMWAVRGKIAASMSMSAKHANKMPDVLVKTESPGGGTILQTNPLQSSSSLSEAASVCWQKDILHSNRDRTDKLKRGGQLKHRGAQVESQRLPFLLTEHGVTDCGCSRLFFGSSGSHRLRPDRPCLG